MVTRDKTGGETVKGQELMELPRIQAKCVLGNTAALMCKACSAALQLVEDEVYTYTRSCRPKLLVTQSAL